MLLGCSGGEACAGTSDPDGCPDLRFEGRAYDRWRELDPPRLMQELGDATYPACAEPAPCGEADPGAFGATDVFRLEGVSPKRAVIGLAEGTTDVYVVFVRQGLDPDTLGVTPRS